MKIALIVEGKTEKAFRPFLESFLKLRLGNRMPRLDPLPYHGRIPTGDKLRRVVESLLSGSSAADHVIALTDVYTGSMPPEFETAADAIRMMQQWVGENPRFHAHAAQHDFEAWLLPYWPAIQRIAGSNRARPGGKPENVNHQNPPAHRIAEAFRTGKRRKAYKKPIDAPRILRGQDVLVAANECPQLKAFLNTIIAICGQAPLP